MPPHDESRHAPLIDVLLVVGLVALAGWLLLDAQIPGLFGQYNDDGTYLVTARALVEGRGYVDPYGAAGLHSPRYPIGMPALVAFCRLVAPTLDQWVFATKAMVGAFALAFVAGGYAFTRRVVGTGPWVTAASWALCIVSAPFLEFGSSVMSELPFAAVSLLALAVGARLMRGDRARWQEPALALALVSCLLLRYAGVALVAAIALGLVLQRRWGALARAGALSAALMLPWLWYRQQVGVVSYVTEFHDTMSAGGAMLAQARQSAATLFVQVLPSIFLPDPLVHQLVGALPMLGTALGVAVSAGVVLGLLAWLREPEASGADRLVPLYVALTVLMDAVWNAAYTSLGPWQHARLLLPVTPFVILLFLREVPRLGRFRQAFAWLVIATLVALKLSNGFATRAYATPRMEVYQDAQVELMEAVRFITPPKATIMVEHPPLCALLTERRVIQLPHHAELVIPQVLQYRVDFLAVSPQLPYEWASGEEDYERDLVAAWQRSYPNTLHLVYRNELNHYQLYQVNRKALATQFAARREKARKHGNVTDRHPD